MIDQLPKPEPAVAAETAAVEEEGTTEILTEKPVEEKPGKQSKASKGKKTTTPKKPKAEVTPRKPKAEVVHKSAKGADDLEKEIAADVRRDEEYLSKFFNRRMDQEDHQERRLNLSNWKILIILP